MGYYIERTICGHANNAVCRHIDYTGFIVAYKVSRSVAVEVAFIRAAG